jgi:hypothetical protein
MAEGIINFYNVATQKEFARDFQFRVDSFGPLTKDDLVYLRTANLPAKTISNQTVPYMGLVFNVPGSVLYTGSESWGVTFLADEAMNIRSKLEAWQTEIFDVNTSSGKYGVPQEICSISLLDKEFKAIRKYNLIGCYLVGLEALAYDIKGSGKPQEFNATLAYQYWQQV